jgi:hypothetical protein
MYQTAEVKCNLLMGKLSVDTPTFPALDEGKSTGNPMCKFKKALVS